MKSKAKGLLFALTCGSMLSVAQAHHSNTLIDMMKTVDVTGVLLAVEFVNPHTQIRLESKDANGNPIIWKFESAPPSWFSRMGIKRSDFAKGIGQPVTLQANIGRNGALIGVVRKMTFADGSVVGFIVDGAPGGKPPGGK